MRVKRNNGVAQDVVLKLGNRTNGKFELSYKLRVFEGDKN